MNRVELQAYIIETYNAERDRPWMDYPNYVVYRHGNDRKWFARVMDVPKTKLGLRGDGILDVVNLKRDPILIGSLLSEPGFFPAYHMSKEHRITASLDGGVSDDIIKMLPDMSYKATSMKRGKRKDPTDA